MTIRLLFSTIVVMLLNMAVDIHTKQWASLPPLLVGVLAVGAWLQKERKAQMHK